MSLLRELVFSGTIMVHIAGILMVHITGIIMVHIAGIIMVHIDFNGAYRWYHL